MFSLGCPCGGAGSQSERAQGGRGECFSYLVSIDGVHVCYPRNVVEYEDVDEDEDEEENQGSSQVLVEYEDTAEDGSESNSQALVKYESTEAAAPEQKCPRSLLQRRGKSLSRMYLALSKSSTSTGSTLVNLSGDPTDERNHIDSPDSKTGQYERIEQIAVDGEGVIHLMRERSTGQLVARKTVEYASLAFNKPIEAAILQDILPERHNNIIRLDAFEPYRLEGARYYFEYCSGGDLHQLVNQYRRHRAYLPEPFIWHVYQQILSALEFLHRGFDLRCPDPERRGVTHRDVKPSNIFLRVNPDAEYPDVVLGDFGHATLDFATYDPAGTFFWQPPELPRHSPRGDVYSLGAVIHFLIHFEAPMAKMPDRFPDTKSAKEAWVAAPEARQPLLEFVDGYGDELICMMLIALEADESKRRNSSLLLKYVSDCIEMRFPSGSGSMRKVAEEWPLASWAFDQEEGEVEGAGAEQYFEMMERFGCGVSRESSRSSSSTARSDWRREVDGRDSSGYEVSSDSSLGETY